MKLKYVTFTGADDKTDLQEINKISNKYSFVEWGFLISKSKMGMQRYPSFETITKIKMDWGKNYSAHICGEICREIIKEGCFKEWVDDNLVGKLLHVANRFQLNFNAKNCDVDLVNLFRFFNRSSELKFILQQNPSNALLIKSIVPYVWYSGKIHILFDCSGGCGEVIQDIPKPIDNIFCGYAGGLNPENLEQKLEEISAVVGDKEIWIDMESGVRTNNEFDLKKVIKCCEIAKKYT